MVLDILMKAFVAGLEEDSLRLDSIAHGATTTGSLAKTYDIVLESRRALSKIQKQLVLHTTKQKAEAFDEISRAPQSVNSIVARFSDQVPRREEHFSQFYNHSSRNCSQLLSSNNYHEISQSQLLRADSSNSCNTAPHVLANGYQGPPEHSIEAIINARVTREGTTILAKQDPKDKCGQLGHFSRFCTNPELQKWEQDLLKQLAIPRESNSACLSVQSIHDLEYNRSCGYFFAGLLPEELHKANLPSWPVPLGWISKSRRRLEQASNQNLNHMKYRPPTSPVNSSYKPLKQDPPICDIDDFADSEDDERRNGSYQANYIELSNSLADVPIAMMPAKYKSSSPNSPSVGRLRFINGL
ncbi:hypothetical protein OnM2_019101 [Erysiphe neolycopersici]|uniref:Uncharacterized protein n=1 Tax=Erysiphe neolycopersici TaxID=212602 RepID=A0A420I3K4_9PEZI|nr:hypothetical protein OnM2_019101 [Erysiphe neolycopersici]